MIPIIGPIIQGLFGMESQNQAQNAATQAQLSNIAHAREMFGLNEQAAHAMAARNEAVAREFLGKNQDFARETAARNEAMQREFAQMGIQWRAEDAKKAGIHPLYALGTGVTAFSPSATITSDAPSSGALGGSAAHVGSSNAYGGDYLSEMGQGLGNALVRMLDAESQARRKLELQQLQANVDKDNAIAAYYLSEAARSSPAGAPPPMTPIEWPEVGWKGSVIDAPYIQSAVKAKPDEIVSRRDSDHALSAGYARPAYMEVQTSAGKFKIPYDQSIGESVESLFHPAVMANAIYENLHDKPWFIDSADRVFNAYHGARDWLSDKYRSLLEGRERDKSGRYPRGRR